ncbi:hypothetical protein Rrhod_0616 [Rhodococcus rhodnii LMG 5362]|uniref:Uncharacterized protein n=1 Tax=Rhodococcus rhodnii LMG 5362 TaxID=1273125 RepID=R7WRI5_9NOCA|nr:hypothetical protein Rrhod_0616 [Rhodococcus rhodnii LMG 5362]
MQMNALVNDSATWRRSPTTRVTHHKSAGERVFFGVPAVTTRRPV